LQKRAVAVEQHPGDAAALVALVGFAENLIWSSSSSSIRSTAVEV
jgi:hypothetical protein